jgi:hypothetical protein
MGEGASDTTLEVLARLKNAILFLEMNPLYFSGQEARTGKRQKGLQMQLIAESPRITSQTRQVRK